MAKFVDENEIEYPIDASKRKLTIGRKGCDITIPPPGSEIEKQTRCPLTNIQEVVCRVYNSVSRQHATLYPNERLLRANKTSYGTKVNDTIIEPEHAIILNNKDSVVFGALCLRYID